MASDRTRDLVLPLAILASVAMGAFIGRSFAGDRAVSSASIGAASGEMEELVDALHAVRAELVEARKAREDTLSSPDGVSRTPAPSRDIPADSDLAKELRSAKVELLASSEALRNAADRARAERAPLVFPETPPDPARLEAAAASTWDVNAKAYMLWTYQQVLDQFGKPESVGQKDSGLSWTYRAKSGRYLYFTFADGRVCQVGTSG